MQDEAPGSQGACRLDVNPGEVAPERMLVAFQHHDVHVGVVARHAPDGEVNGPAADDPVGTVRLDRSKQAADTAAKSESLVVLIELPPGGGGAAVLPELTQ